MLPVVQTTVAAVYPVVARTLAELAVEDANVSGTIVFISLNLL
jgi:hypothetical protein